MRILTRHRHLTGFQTVNGPPRISQILYRFAERGCPGGEFCQRRHDADHEAWLARHGLPPAAHDEQPARADSAGCDHPVFESRVEVSRLTSSDGGPVTGYAADITIRCRACGLPFRFLGLPCGLSPEQLMVSVLGDELRAPIEPVEHGLAARLAMIVP